MLVSVSLQSIVHSYVPEDSLQKAKSILFSFRLLTEYHSFLSIEKMNYTSLINSSFRLLTEYRSFLWKLEASLKIIGIEVSVSLRSIIHSYKPNYLL